MEVLFAIVGGWFLASVVLAGLLALITRSSVRAERVCQRLLLDSGYEPYDQERDCA